MAKTDIHIIKVTESWLMQKAAAFTKGGKESTLTLEKAYRLEHSPMRTQMFWIEMIAIPTYCSVHLVRHKTWIEHFVQSNREDRGGNKEADRNTPINHGMFTNAQELIFMSQRRLCYGASPATREIMEDIRETIGIVDPHLQKFMVPMCVYRGGLCPDGNCTFKGMQMDHYGENYFKMFKCIPNEMNLRYG